MQHPLWSVAPVDLTPLPELLTSFPRIEIVLLNSLQTVNGQMLLRLAALKQIHFDLGTLEGVGGIGNLMTQISSSKIMFGSHAPFFYFESALLKLKESILLDSQRSAIVRENAQRLLAKG